MKKGIRKLAFLAFTALFTGASVLTGCSSKTPENTASAVNPSKLSPYSLDFYYATENANPKDLKLVQDAMSAILTKKINATVVLHPIDIGSYTDKTNLLFASGEKADVVFSATGATYPVNVSKGAFLPLDDLLTKYGQDIVKADGMDFIKGTSVNGKIYAVPTLKEKGVEYGFIFNTALVNKYKFDLTKIKTYKDIEPMLATIKQNEPDVTPLCESVRNMGRFYSGPVYETVASITALPLSSKDLKVVDPYTIPEYVDILNWVHNMYDKGYVNKSALTDTNNGPMQNGKAFCQPFDLKPGRDKELTASWGFDVEQVVLTQPYMPATQAQGAMLSIGRTSTDSARAMMFLNLLYTDKDLLNTLVFGVENTDYVKKSDNVIDYLPGQNAQTVGYSNAAWRFGNQFLNYTQATEDPKKWDAFKDFNNKVTVSRLQGFTWDATNVSSYVAAVTNAQKQYIASLSIGAVDPTTTIPKLQAAQKAAGYDTILAEVQKQIDAWAASNKK